MPSQNDTVSLLWPRRVRPTAGLLGALSLLCGLSGCDKPPPPSQKPLASTQKASDAQGSSPLHVRPGDDDVLLPVYTHDILSARVDAQKRLLGRGKLFEDLEGKAIPVEQGLSNEESFENDMLAALPGSAGHLGESALSETRVNGNALGLYVPIENPAKHQALAHFYTELRKLDNHSHEDGEDGKVRILAYGASHTQGDIYTGYLRNYLQSRFGNGGHGYISLAKINKWFRQFDIGLEASKGWRIEHAQRRDSREDGYFGLLGASTSSSKRSDRSRVYPRRDEPDLYASAFEVAYLAQPKGGKFSIWVDGEPFKTVDTRAEDARPAYHTFQLPLGIHEFEFRPTGNGEVRLLGMTSEREEQGIVLDTLGISGTRAANMLKWNEEFWTQAIRRRQPDLYMLAYGTNESTDLNQPIERYRQRLRLVIERFQRAVPEASCLIVGPGDVPREVQEGVWAPRPRLHAIVEIQRELAYDMGCGFWDAREFMGGIGSMQQWATSSPQMASRDRIHLTRRGYVRMGMALADAIMAGYDGHEE